MSLATNKFSHTGWETYYREHTAERAWNGVPDAFLIENLDIILARDAQIVLDVASGDGRNTEPFLGRGLSVVAIDLSATALATFGRRCRDDNIQQALLINDDFLETNFLSAQFDTIVCFNSVPHFEDPAACIEKMVSLLRPGGRLAFNSFSPGDVAYGLGEKIGEDKYYYKETLFTFMTEDDVRSILPKSATVVRSETRRWEEPDHGTYRRGVHTHEACFFIVERRPV